jgi:hypothetical protein
VDTEGTELDVLRGLDFDEFCPGVIVSENNWDENDVRQFLDTKDYRFWKRIEVNDFFVKEE